MGVQRQTIMTTPLDTLVEMTRALGEPQNDYVIIGEGNTSMTIDAESFAVKASGHQMHNISADGFVTVYFEPIPGIAGRSASNHERAEGDHTISRFRSVICPPP